MSEKTLNQKMEDLNRQVEWFYSDDFKLEDAISKYEETTKLANDIEKDLNELKNKIEILKEKFDK
ncbi:exodeoxyribonuclease VII small subunit [Candidatus Saccharibacteria bacterium]|nr:exodeoxyribonuclease VII small subunit [Candidatus Saccharibacteria bacterium]